MGALLAFRDILGFHLEEGGMGGGKEERYTEVLPHEEIDVPCFIRL